MKFLAFVAAMLWIGATPALAAIGTPVSIGTISNANPSVTRQIGSVTTPAGAMIFVVMMDTEGLVPVSVTDSAGNTYTPGTGVRTGNAGVGSVEMRAFYTCNATAMSGGTITGTFQAADPILKTMHASYTTGIATTSCADNQATPTHNTNTNPSITTGTLAQADEIVFGYTAVENGSTTTYTEASGFTNVSQTAVSDRLSVARKIVSATTAVTYAPTVGASRHWASGTWTFKGASSYPTGVVTNGLQAVWDLQTTAGNNAPLTVTPNGSTCAGLNGCSFVNGSNVFLVGSGGTYTNNNVDFSNFLVWIDGTGTFNFTNAKWGGSNTVLLLDIGNSGTGPTVNCTNCLFDYSNITAGRQSGVLIEVGNFSAYNSRFINAGLDFITSTLPGSSNTIYVEDSYFHGLGTAATAGVHLEFAHQRAGTFTFNRVFLDGRSTTLPSNSWTGYFYPEADTQNVTWTVTNSIMSGAGTMSNGNYGIQVGTKPFINSGTFNNNAFDPGSSGYFSRDSNSKLTASGNVDLAAGSAITISTGTAIPEVSVAPTQTGTAQVGQTQTCNQGSWTNSLSSSYAYGWERRPSATAGYEPIAATQTYVLQSADSGTGKLVRCTVRATNASGIGQYWTTGQSIAP